MFNSLTDRCSSCRACEAAFGCAAVVESDTAVLLVHRAFRFHDGSAAERCLAVLGSCYKVSVGRRWHLPIHESTPGLYR